MNVRHVTSLAVLAAAGLSITACSPPHEQPSDIKVRTATSQDPASIGGVTASSVQFIDCVGSPAFEPPIVTLDCSNPQQRITEITWDSWEENRAQGTGTDPEGNPVNVVLDKPTESGNGLVFSRVNVEGRLVAN